MIYRDLRPWLRPAAYISLASVSCVIYNAFTPPLLGPELVAKIPLIGSLPGDLPGYWARFVLSFLLLGAAPFVLALAFGDRPRDLGLRVDVPLLRSPLFWLVGLPVALAVGAMGVITTGLGDYYPYSRDLIGRVAAEGALPFVGHCVAYTLLYYLPWELLFRGFLLLSLLGAAGRASGATGSQAIARSAEFEPGETSTTTGGAASDGGATAVASLVLFQTLPSAMLHVGHPVPELLEAVVAGIGFGVLAWRTKSIVPGLIIHAALGIGTDAYIVLAGVGKL